MDGKKHPNPKQHRLMARRKSHDCSTPPRWNFFYSVCKLRLQNIRMDTLKELFHSVERERYPAGLVPENCRVMITAIKCTAAGAQFGLPSLAAHSGFDVFHRCLALFCRSSVSACCSLSLFIAVQNKEENLIQLYYSCIIILIGADLFRLLISYSCKVSDIMVLTSVV